MQPPPILETLHYQSTVSSLLQVERTIPEEAVPKILGCHTRGTHMQAGACGVAQNCQAEEDMGQGVSKD